MKVVEIHEAFGLDRLRVTERPSPEPGAGEVLLEMRCASLNYRDLLTVRGEYNPRQPLPLIPCSDGLGRVSAVGENVTRVKPGDRVAPIFAQRWIGGRPTRTALRSTLGGPLDGTLAEEMVLPEESVVRVPDHLTDEEAATLPCAALTAWSALVTQGEAEKGDTILILGTGGVSIFALQLAKILGLRAIVTSCNDDKLSRARELGAWETINYEKTPEWGKRVMELTDKEGVDLVIEVGGAATLAQSLTAVRFGGQISLIGSLTGTATDVSLARIFMRHVRVQGIFVGHREGFEAMNRVIASHGLRPVIDRVFPLNETRQALEYLAEGAHFGKVCVRVQET